MKDKIIPTLLYADAKGNIYNHPHLLMVCRRGEDFQLPGREDLIQLPPESSIFFLPERKAVGLDPSTGKLETVSGYAVAAFVCPGYTLSATCAYIKEEKAPSLPLFAYGAVGYYKGKFFVCAKKVDNDIRQVFKNISQKRIRDGVKRLIKKYPENRLISHLGKCALTYCCPAARNLALGRFEAPLPTSKRCNARCIGCISYQPKESGFPATQERITFTPSPKEIVEVMEEHASKERRPIFSFGQGCEGEPLTEWKTILKAIQIYRQKGGIGTININTNGSITKSIPDLADAGLSSLRISLNSANYELYSRYYRPRGYDFHNVKSTIKIAKQKALFVSINLLYFPGVTDSEAEINYLMDLIEDTKLDFIQLRNLNIDPDIYLALQDKLTPSTGLVNFKKRLKKQFPWIKFGYFNPYLG
jgi:pyruvate-formate lyase-activating enzyme